MGGLDDGRLVVWDIAKRFDFQYNTKKIMLISSNCTNFFGLLLLFQRQAICGGLAKNEVTGAAFSLCSSNKSGTIFLTCGERKFAKIKAKTNFI